MSPPDIVHISEPVLMLVIGLAATAGWVVGFASAVRIINRKGKQ